MPAFRTSYGPAAGGHELIVSAQFDYLAMLENADAICVTHRGEAVRDQYGSGVPGSGQDPFKDLRLAPNIELGSRFIEKHNSGAQLYCGQGPCEGDALPLPSR